MTTVTTRPPPVAFRRPGIALSLFGGTNLWNIEIERAPDAAGTPDTANAEIIDSVPGSESIYVDLLPVDDRVWYYRIRHNRPQCSPGTWSPWTRGVKAILLPDPLPDPPILDFVKVSSEASQPSTAVGRLKITVKDPQTRVIAVEFQKKETAGDFLGPDGTANTWFNSWDTQVGNPGVDRIVTFTEDVVLQAGHNSGIKWRVRYLDFDGTEIEIVDAHTFDLDQVPDVVFGLTLFGDEVWLSWEGDEDTQSIREVTNIDLLDSDMPTAVELDTGEVHAGQQSDGVLLHSGIAFGQSVYVRARGYSDAVGGGIKSTTDFTARITRDAGQTTTPIVSAEPSQDDSTGQLSLTIIDPHGVVTGTGFAKKIGGGGFGAFVDDKVAPFDTAATVSILEKHNSAIAWRVYFLDDGGTERFIGGSHSFDVNRQPAGIAALHRTGLAVNLSYQGDEDVGSIRYATSKTAFPSQAAVDAGTVVVGRSGNGINIESALQINEDLFVRVAYYSSSDGTFDGINTFRSAEDTLVATANPTGVDPVVVEAAATESGGNGNLALTIHDPQGYVTEVCFARKSGPGAFSVFSCTSPPTLDTTDSVALSEKHISSIKYQVKWDANDGFGVRVIEDRVDFDADDVANIVDADVDILEGGTATYRVAGDLDTAKIYITNAIDADPPDPTAANADVTVIGRTGSGNLTLVPAFGQRIVAKFRGENAGGVLAPAATIKVVSRTRGKGEPAGTDQAPTVDLSFSNVTVSAMDVTATAVLGSKGVGPLHVQFRSWRAGSVAPAWPTTGGTQGDGWSTSPLAQTFNRLAFDLLFVEARARDVGLANLIGPTKFFAIRPVSGVTPLDPIPQDPDQPPGGPDGPMGPGGDPPIGDRRDPTQLVFEGESESGVGTPIFDPAQARTVLSGFTVPIRTIDNLTTLLDPVTQKIGTALQYPSGSGISALEPAEASAEQTTGKSWSVMIDRLLDNLTGGTLNKGLISESGASPAAGMRIDGGLALPGTWVRWFDLAADAAGEFLINHPALTVEGDGSATFGGEVAASTFTAPTITQGSTANEGIQLSPTALTGQPTIRAFVAGVQVGDFLFGSNFVQISAQGTRDIIFALGGGSPAQIELDIGTAGGKAVLKGGATERELACVTISTVNPSGSGLQPGHLWIKT